MTRSGRPSKELEAAKAWLVESLAHGQRLVSDVEVAFAEAKRKGEVRFSWMTVLRAKAAMGIHHSQQGSRQWYWSLTPTSQAKEVGKG